MSATKRIVISLLASVLLWVVFTWPLPRHMDRAIPYSSQAYHAPGVCSMTPGDHLQYLYYLVLVKDMIFGDTPLFYNLYEFNTGNDAERYEPDPYYLPFVLLFSLFSAFGSDAFGWNMLGLVTTWISLWATWAVVRRYTAHEWIAAAAALATLVMPFRWANLLGGSPLGAALIWTPLLMLGLDMAVRENRIRGGMLAGICLLFSLWTDMHSFFFLTMFTPAWCLVAFVKRDDFAWSEWSSYRKLIAALIPVPLFLAAAIGIRQLHTQHLVAESTRTWHEAALYSPRFSGLFGLEQGVTGHIYLGYGLIAMMIFGLLALAGVCFERRKYAFPMRDAMIFLMLFCGVAGVVILSLGTFGPAGGKIFDLARLYMPFYSNIRQSAKIYCLIAPLISLLMAVAYSLAVFRFRRSFVTVCWMALVGWFMWSGFRHVAIAMTWLDLDQGAYAAVASDAAQRHVRTGAVIIPLWPGDSHYSSVYQTYSVHYRIKMANGYKPMPDSQYEREFFDPFRSVNEGVLTDAQIDALLDRGIHYLILHQNMFPEKVSAFPVGETLVRLMNHPRIELLKQDERVWSFRLLREPVAKTAIKSDWNFTFPARRLEAESYAVGTSNIIADTSAGREKAVRLSAGNVITSEVARAAASPTLAWLIRTRGHGSIAVNVQSGGMSREVLSVNDDAWAWHRVALPATNPIVESAVELTGISGTVDVDMMVLVDGEFPVRAPGDSAEIGAARFFHAGFMNLENETVTFEKGEDQIAIAFYGPKWPLDPGTYEVEMLFNTDELPGTYLGVINLEHDDLTGRGIPVEVIAGKSAKGVVEKSDNLPFNMAYVFHGTGDITIKKIRVTRIQ